VSSHVSDFLKGRVLSFLESARADYAYGDYNLVLFHVEQFLQLYLKHLLYKRIGDFPKFNSLICLMKNVMRVYEESLRRFYEENLETLYLEEAYMAPRYLPRQYEREIAERMLRFAENSLEVLRCSEEGSQ